MLEVADLSRRSRLLPLRRHGQRLDGGRNVRHVVVCRDWPDAQGAAHQPETNTSDHPVVLFVALDADFVAGVLVRANLTGNKFVAANGGA